MGVEWDEDMVVGTAIHLSPFVFCFFFFGGVEARAEEKHGTRGVPRNMMHVGVCVLLNFDFFVN